MALIGNETSARPDYVPHYLLAGDPFASKLSKEADIVAAFYICIIGIMSAIGNGYVIYMTIKRKTKLRPPELMTVNLAIFDFGISGTWLKRQHAFLSMVFVWLYAGFWATMPLVGWGNYAPEPFGTSCTLDWWLAQASVAGQSFVIAILFFCLIFPTGIIVFSYVMIIFKVKSSAKEISHFDTRNQNSHNLEMKLTKVAMLICAGFLIAWIPYAVVSVVSAFGEPDSVPISVSVIPTLLAKSSAMYNPIIYQVIDLKHSCAKSSCFQVLKKRTHFKKSRFYTISGSLKVSPSSNESHI
ncbi:opsin-5-like isoform 2-T3 [Salvelinus alpinus]|uniref:opsin-5 isoform X2 n=1 Tax=Salvelinus sp. IW2-2015 TaxID=2691554 RepID=UPI000CDFED08|nr:opsin-5 isoform X2 [Salvelinus alpinus]